MTDETESIAALKQELAELEAALQAVQHARQEQANAAVAEVERERELWRVEQEELARRQAAIIQRGQADAFWWADGGYLGGD